jgi:hypothetical protein
VDGREKRSEKEGKEERRNEVKQERRNVYSAAHCCISSESAHPTFSDSLSHNTETGPHTA